MPIYEYKPASAEQCPHCDGGFDQLQKLADEPLISCPVCGAACKRVISAPNVQSGQSHNLKEANLGKKGFTQYKKIGKGEYEKTTGKGPSHIIDKD
jgi:putative FmdB family regulatory protein